MVHLKLTEWLSETWKGWSDQMPSNDVINRSCVVVRPAIHPPPRCVFLHEYVCVCVCCWSHPTTKATAVCSSMRQKKLGGCSHTNTRKAPPPHPAMAMLHFHWRILPSAPQEISSHPLCNTLTQHTFILTQTFWSAHTPWKIPKPFTSSERYTSPLPLTCFYKVKHSREEGKNTWSS